MLIPVLFLPGILRIPLASPSKFAVGDAVVAHLWSSKSCYFCT